MRTNAYRNRSGMALLAAGVLLVLSPRFVQATALEVKAQQPSTFYVDNTAGQSQVTVFSESTLEDFTVLCNNVNGEWRFDPQNVEKMAGRYFIRVADLKTGIARRDHDLQDPEWLDAARFPEIVIQVNRFEGVNKKSGNIVTGTLVGTCTVHGVTHDVRVPCTLAYLDQSPTTMKVIKGDLIRIRGELAINLSDYKVAGPVGANAVGLKVSDHLPIKVTVFGSTEKPPPPLKVSQPGAVKLPGSAASQPAQPGGGEPSILQTPTQPAQ